MWTHTKESRDRITPHQALTYLKEGNARFVNNLRISRDLLKQMNQTSTGQYPFATVLSCMDSRTSAELIFDQGLGDILSIRIAGNVVNNDVLGCMEYACDVVQTKIIVVLGHTQCGAISSACSDYKSGHFSSITRKIKPSIEEGPITPELLDRVCINHIHHSVRLIRSRSTLLRSLEKEGRILLVGALYSVETGTVIFL
jgi:carbonic anhydrase